MQKIRVCFDFDETLDRTIIQEYAEELILRGIDVWICTMRPFDLKKWEWIDRKTGIRMEREWNNGMDIFPISDKIGIPRNQIIFTGFHEKWSFIKDKDFIWILDDDWNTIRLINKYTKTIGISSMSGSWKQKCERILKQKMK